MKSEDAVTASTNNEIKIINRKLPFVYYEVSSFSDLDSITLRSSSYSCTLRWLKPFTSANRFGSAPWMPCMKKGLNSSSKASRRKMLSLAIKIVGLPSDSLDSF
jgi:hypothetical protein